MIADARIKEWAGSTTPAAGSPGGPDRTFEMADRQTYQRPGAGRNPGARTDGEAGGRQSGEEVARVLRRASYFSVFAVPDPSDLSVGLPLVPFIQPLIY